MIRTFVGVQDQTNVSGAKIINWMIIVWKIVSRLIHLDFYPTTPRIQLAKSVIQSANLAALAMVLIIVCNVKTSKMVLIVFPNVLNTSTTKMEYAKSVIRVV